MKNYLARLNKGKLGVVSRNIVEAGAYGAASYGYGFIQNKYREKASVKGIPADAIAGTGFKIISIAMQCMGKDGVVASGVDILGNAGIGAFCHTLGAGHGAKSSGVVRLLINERDKAKALAAIPGATVLAGTGQAPTGAFLSQDKLRAMANS